MPVCLDKEKTKEKKEQKTKRKRKHLFVSLFWYFLIGPEAKKVEPWFWLKAATLLPAAHRKKIKVKQIKTI
jgi:hypothetical protein